MHIPGGLDHIVTWLVHFYRFSFLSPPPVPMCAHITVRKLTSCFKIQFETPDTHKQAFRQLNCSVFITSLDALLPWGQTSFLSCQWVELNRTEHEIWKKKRVRGAGEERPRKQEGERLKDNLRWKDGVNLRTGFPNHRVKWESEDLTERHQDRIKEREREN